MNWLKDENAGSAVPVDLGVTVGTEYMGMSGMLLVDVVAVSTEFVIALVLVEVARIVELWTKCSEHAE